LPPLAFACLLRRFRARRRLRGARMFRLMRGLARSRRLLRLRGLAPGSLLCLRLCGLSPGGFGPRGLGLPLRVACLRLLRLLCLARLYFALGVGGTARLFGLLRALLVGAHLVGTLLPHLFGRLARLRCLLIACLAIDRGALRLCRTLCLLRLLLALAVGDLPVARCTLRVGHALRQRGAVRLRLPLRFLRVLPVGRLLGLALLCLALLCQLLRSLSLCHLDLCETLLRLGLLLRRLRLGEPLLRLLLRLLLRSPLLGETLLRLGLALRSLRLRKPLLRLHLLLPDPLGIGAGLRAACLLGCERRLLFAH